MHLTLIHRPTRVCPDLLGIFRTTSQQIKPSVLLRIRPILDASADAQDDVHRLSFRGASVAQVVLGRTKAYYGDGEYDLRRWLWRDVDNITLARGCTLPWRLASLFTSRWIFSGVRHKWTATSLLGGLVYGTKQLVFLRLHVNRLDYPYSSLWVPF